MQATRRVRFGTITVPCGWRYHPAWRWLLLAAALLVLLLWLRRTRRRSSRFLHNGQFARLLLRLGGLALFAFAVYLGWRYLEGAERLLPLVL